MHWAEGKMKSEPRRTPCASAMTKLSQQGISGMDRRLAFAVVVAAVVGMGSKAEALPRDASLETYDVAAPDLAVPVALCARRCAGPAMGRPTGKMYIPGPAYVCQRRGLQYCGPGPLDKPFERPPNMMPPRPMVR